MWYEIHDPGGHLNLVLLNAREPR